jgi:hypothetical protein
MRSFYKLLAWVLGIPIGAIILFFMAIAIYVEVDIRQLKRDEAQVEKGLAHIADTGQPYEPWLQYDLVCFGPRILACSDFLAAARKAGHEPKDLGECCSLSDSQRERAVGYLRAGKFSCAAINDPRHEADEKLCFVPSRLHVKRAIGRFYVTIDRLEPGEYFKIGEREN